MKKSIGVFTFLLVFTFFLSSQEILENSDKPLNPNAGRILEVEEGLRITDERTEKTYDIPVKILFISKEEKIIKECPGIPMKTFISQNIYVGMGRSITIMSKDGQVLYLSDPDEYMISVLDLEKLEFTKKFKRNYPRVKRPKRKPSQLSVKIPERKYFSDIVYLYTFMGNLWVRTSTNDEKKGTLYDVFDSTGQYIDCFWLNAGESLQTTHENFLFVREEDEDGNMNIVQYRVLEYVEQ